MAKLESYNRHDLDLILAEAYRLWTDENSYENDVDLSRSYLNKSMAHPDWVFTPGALGEGRKVTVAKVTERCKAVMGDRKMQSQTNVVGSWVITAPEEILDDPDKMTKFFEVVYRFTCDRYGYENVVDGVIHYDEGKPHMTVYVVPVCKSRKTGRETVSSASMWGKNTGELRSYHQDLEAVMTKELGMKGLVLNGRTIGNYTIKELKARTAMENKLAEERRSIDDDRNAINEHVMKVNESVDAFNEQVAGFEEYKRKYKNEISAEKARHEKEMAEERARLAQEREEARDAKEAAEASRRANQSLLASLRGMLRAIREFDAELSERDKERLAEFTQAYEDKKRELAEIDKLFIRDEIEDGSMGAKSEQYFAKRRHGTDSDLL